MRHGIGLYETGFMSWGIIIVILVIVFLGLAFLFKSRKKTSDKHKHLIEILNERYAKGEIGEDKYHEIKMIIEDEISESSAMMIAKERYVKGEISSKEFIVARDFINLNSK
jgi:uncharacterized membrane protein